MALPVKDVLRRLHRWIGLTLGFGLTVISVSGTLLLFQPQFFRWAHGELIPAGTSQQQVGSLETWVENADAAVPGVAGPFFIWPPQTSHNISDAGMVLYRDEPGGLGKSGFIAVLVAPATGAVLGVVDIDRSPAYAPIFLHGRLWAGPVGIVLVGSIAAGSLLLLLIGPYLWWPPRERLVRKLSVRPWKSTFLHAARLHDWAGIWSFMLLIVVVGTGLYMARPDWVAPVLKLLPSTQATAAAHSVHASAHTGVESVQGTCRDPIGLDRATTDAHALAPGTVFHALHAMGNELPVRRWRVGFKPAQATAPTQQTFVDIDLQCGTVALVGTPDARAERETAELLLEGLHDGTQFGFAGQILVAIVGLIPLVLMWSGLVRWWTARRYSVKQRAVATRSSTAE